MKIEATPEAAAVVERAKRDRGGSLVVTIGTGCCESTAPFLYDDFWPGPDHEQVGEVAGVPVVAPEHLRRLYPDDDGLVLDLGPDELAESMSIETEYSCRLTLRHEDAPRVERERCDTAPARSVTGQLPEALRGVRFR